MIVDSDSDSDSELRCSSADIVLQRTPKDAEKRQGLNPWGCFEGLLSSSVVGERQFRRDFKQILWCRDLSQTGKLVSVHSPLLQECPFSICNRRSTSIREPRESRCERYYER